MLSILRRSDPGLYSPVGSVDNKTPRRQTKEIHKNKKAEMQWDRKRCLSGRERDRPPALGKLELPGGPGQQQRSYPLGG